MKEKKPFRENQAKEPISAIPDLDIIDLEVTDSPETQEPPSSEAAAEPKRRFSHIYLHIALLAMTFVCIFIIIYRFTNWGVYIDLNKIFEDEPSPTTIIDTLDQVLPLMDADKVPVYQDYNEDSVILAFGNAPFADDRDSKDNLINMIQDMTGAKIYNCSISGSCLAADSPDPDIVENPWDVFTFYGLCRLITLHNKEINARYLNAVEALGEAAPAEAMDVYNTLTSIDLETVDVVVMMYDASDYFAGHPACTPSVATDATSFTGNMEGGIECLQVFYPDIRIIVLSPAYAYGIDDNGNYVSSDIKRYGSDTLSVYVHRQSESAFARSVSFVDNLYGTIHEDNAADYLTDHLHLNLEGRKKVARRFVDALYYFQKSD